MPSQTEKFAGPSRNDFPDGRDKRPKNSPQATLPICRDRASPIPTPQIRQGSAPSWRGQRLWALRELRGGPGRTRTSNQTVMSGRKPRDLGRNSVCSMIFIHGRECS